MDSKRGRFIAFEGIDGSGKGTQTEIFSRKLDGLGIKHETFAFPRHGHPAAYFVDKYLSLEANYGEADAVKAHRASFFYALDRYDASFEIKRILEEGRWVIADRFLGSNIGHQGGKIEDDQEREKYVEWLYDLEFNTLGVPRPDLNIILFLPPEIAIRRLKQRERKEDGHELNLDHLRRASRAYEWLAGRHPEEFELVHCAENGRELAPEEIGEKVWEIISGRFGLN